MVSEPATIKAHTLYMIAACSAVLLAAHPAQRVCASDRSSPEVKDPVEMVLVPAATFTMGSMKGYPDEQPLHEVTLDAFYMDVHEVSNRQYKKFLDETKHLPPIFWFPEIDRPADPVVGITWADASAYAKWAGKRLPTEAEWEYAARGGSTGTKFPWGDKPDPDYANLESFGILPVQSLQPNGYGLYDMIGNVWEWCHDWYNRDYYRNSPTKNPHGPPEGKYRVLRGWSWENNRYHARTTKRYTANPAAKSFSIGFRCVKSAPDSVPAPP